MISAAWSETQPIPVSHSSRDNPLRPFSFPHRCAQFTLFNDTLTTFCLRLYGVRYMVKDHSDNERENPLPPHVLLFQGFFYMYHPTDRRIYITAFVTPVVEYWLQREIAVVNRWSVVEYPLRNAVWNSFNILFSSMNRLNRVFKTVVSNVECYRSIVIWLCATSFMF